MLPSPAKGTAIASTIEFEWQRLREDAEYRRMLTRDVQVDDILRDDGRRIFQTNLLAACWVLGYTRVDPVMHAEMIAFFPVRDPDKPYTEQFAGIKPKGTNLQPRGAFKSTVSEVDMVQELTCFPAMCTICVMSANQNLARAIVDNVAAHFIKNKFVPPSLFQALFPELCVTPTAAGDSGKFTTAIRQTTPPIREDAIMAFSVESGASGWHFQRMRCDDIANNRNMKTEASQAEVWRNYTTNRKMLNPGGFEDKLGTRYGPNDPYGMELKSSPPGSYRYTVKAAMYLKSGERLDANGFPKKDEATFPFAGIGLTYEYLRDEYEMDYSSFMLQYMNDSYGDAEVTFPDEMIRASFRPASQMPYAGMPEIRWRLPNKAAGWGHAVAAVGLQAGLRMNILDVRYGAWKPSALALLIVQLAKEHQVGTVTIEDSPGARRIEPSVHNYAATLGYRIEIQWSEYQADTAERDIRIKSLEPLLASGRVLMVDNLQLARRVFEQFTTYGMTEENGIPDVISRLAELLPASIVRPGALEADANARRIALERDHLNFYYGGANYVAPEPDPIADALDAYAEEPPAFDSYGLANVMPGLNG